VTGRWSAATASGAEVLRLARETGQHEIAALPTAHLTVIAAWRGDEEGLRSGVEQTRRILAQHPIELVHDELRWARGAGELTSGRPDAAAETLCAIRHPAIAMLASLDRVEALVQSGQPDSARPVLEQLAAFAEHSGAAWAAARAAHCRALLDAGPAAASHFEEALVEHRAGGRLFDRARTELAYGTTLRRARRRAEARPHLRAALSAFEDLDAAPWAERARLELRASGETARRRDPSAVLALPPQEMQVALFVARGLPPREVAAQLFRSPRTVEYHLRNVFAKLRVTSRTELARLPLQ